MSPSRISRRNLLQLGAVAAASLSGLPAAGHAPNTPKDGAPALNNRVSLAAYSMRKALTNGEMDLFGFIDWCGELQLAGAELTSYYFRENFDTKYLQELRHRAFRRGVTISGTAVRNNFCLPPGEERDREVAHVKSWIDHAAELFAPHIRIFAGNVPRGVDHRTAIGWVADAIREVLELAERRGIIIGLENHGGITTRTEDHLAICDAVGEHPWFGINLDTGNYRHRPYEELALAAPRAVNVQVKAEIRDPEGNKIAADYSRIQKILAEAGYQGWVVLEYEAEADPWTEIPRHLERLKSLFEAC